MRGSVEVIRELLRDSHSFESECGIEASPEKFGVPTVSARNRSCEPRGLLPTLTNKGNPYVS